MEVYKFIKNKISQFRLEYYFFQYYNGKQFSSYNMNTFIKLLVEYCKETKYSFCSLKKPTITIETMSESCLGKYSKEENAIQINKSLIDDVCSGKTDIMEIVDVVGHEMEHYKQNSIELMFDALTAEQQKEISGKVRTEVCLNKKDLVFTDEEIKTIIDLAASNNFKTDLHKQYNNIDEYYDDVSEGAYLSQASERESRISGKLLVRELVKKLLDRRIIKKYCGSKIVKAESIYEDGLIEDENEYFRKEQLYNDFASQFNLNLEEVLELAKEVETSCGVVNGDFKDNYKSALKFLLRDLDLKQKVDLINQAIVNNCSILTEASSESIKSEINFKQKRIEISKQVGENIVKDLKRPDSKIKARTIVNCLNILEHSEYEDILLSVLGINIDEAIGVLELRPSNEFSADFIINSEIIISKINNLDPFKKRWFYVDLFRGFSTKDLIEHLEGGILSKNAAVLIRDHIKNDKEYEKYDDFVCEAYGINL